MDIVGELQSGLTQHPKHIDFPAQEDFKSRRLRLEYLSGKKRKRDSWKRPREEFNRNWDDFDDDLIPGLPNNVVCKHIWPRLFGVESKLENKLRTILLMREINWMWVIVVEDSNDMFEFQLKLQTEEWLGNACRRRNIPRRFRTRGCRFGGT